MNSNILFIFDNVEAYKDIEPCLNGIMNISKDKVQVIITTKNNALSDDIENIKLLPFSKKEAILFLKESLKNRLSDQDINDLIEEFGSKDEVLPYGLSKVVAYLKENKLLKVKDYISYLHNNKDERPETILLLEILEKSPLAWQILQYSAHLDPEFISINIFKELFLIDEEKLQEPIKRLEELSLMNLIRQDGQSGLQLHRLVQDSVKRYVDKHKEQAIDEQKICTKLAKTLDDLFPVITDAPNQDWEIAKLLYPHTVKILDDDNIKINKFRKPSLCQKVGFYDEEILCKFENALKCQQKVLKLNQELYQSDHPNLARAFNSLGLAYYRLGELENALIYCEKALKMRQKLFQGNHPDIAYSFDFVGTIYGILGNTEEELKYYKEALEIRKKLYKGSHIDTAWSFDNVGWTYGKLGNIEEELKYKEEALKMRKELYQGNHPNIAYSIISLGVAYGNLGKVEEELKYQKEALNMYQELYQDNHPSIARSFNNIGSVYGKLHKNKEELKYKEKALKMYQRLYGGNHPDIANSLINVGWAYGKLKNIEEELKYQEEALKMYQELYQGNHPSIVHSLNSVGLVYQILGYISKALRYKENALKMCQELYQRNHYEIAWSFDVIGIIYEKLGDTNKALELCKQSYLMYVQTLGLDHPHTKKLENYLEKAAPEFIKNNETREFIFQRGDFDEFTLDIKEKIQQKVLNKIYINAAKAKWSRLSILGNLAVKGYLSDKYLARKLGVLSSAKNIEMAKMLCFEAICLGAINHPNKNFICAIEFTKAYRELTQKILTEHPEYFIDGSIMRECVGIISIRHCEEITK